MFSVFLIATVLVTSYLLTRAMLIYGHQFHLIDVPNDRSSHTHPTQRGGGVAIVVASLLAIAASINVAHLDGKVASGLLISGGVIAVVGFWDDRCSLSPVIRLIAQVAAGSVLIFFIGFPIAIDFGFAKLSGSFALVILVATAVSWLINLTNFMDGIDGLAGAECVFVMVAGGALLNWHGDHDLAYVCFAMAAAAMGFLLMNWPPAEIFMGDVGSGYIGLVFGAIMLIDSVRHPNRVWVWLILLTSFLTDSTVTLIRRLMAGKPAWVAHRTHAYQHAALRWGHKRITLTFIAVNVLWLWPLAMFASARPQYGSGLFVVAVLPLAMVVWHLGAGTDGLVLETRYFPEPVPANESPNFLE